MLMWGACRTLSSLRRGAAEAAAFPGCCFACLIQSIPHEPASLLTVAGINSTLILTLTSEVGISLGWGHNECPIHETTNTVKRREREKKKKVSHPNVFLISKQL